MSMEFKERLRQRRRFLNFTQEYLGSLVGVEKATISGYERGTSRPDIDMLAKLSKELKVSTDWLLGLSDEVEWEFS